MKKKTTLHTPKLADDSNFSSHSLKIDGAEFKYWDNGQKGPVLIMVHGFTGNHGGLVDTASHIEGVHTILPDLPGFGDSDLPAHLPYTIDTLVELLAEFIKALKLKEPPFLHGHSLGSIVVARLARAYPELIASKLILQNPTARRPLRASDPRAAGALIGVWHYWVGKQVPGGKRVLRSKTISKLLTRQIITTNDPPLRHAITQHHINDLAYIREQYYYDIYRSVLRYDILDVAPEIPQHTLIVAGAKDNISPLKYQQLLAHTLKKATLVEIEDIGHLTHFESPALVAKNIESFVLSND